MVDHPVHCRRSQLRTAGDSAAFIAEQVRYLLQTPTSLAEPCGPSCQVAGILRWALELDALTMCGDQAFLSATRDALSFHLRQRNEEGQRLVAKLTTFYHQAFVCTQEGQAVVLRPLHQLGQVYLRAAQPIKLREDEAFGFASFDSLLSCPQSTTLLGVGSHFHEDVCHFVAVLLSDLVQTRPLAVDRIATLALLTCAAPGCSR